MFEIFSEGKSFYIQFSADQQNLFFIDLLCPQLQPYSRSPEKFSIFWPLFKLLF